MRWRKCCISCICWAMSFLQLMLHLFSNVFYFTLHTQIDFVTRWKMNRMFSLFLFCMEKLSLNPSILILFISYRKWNWNLKLIQLSSTTLRGISFFLIYLKMISTRCYFPIHKNQMNETPSEIETGRLLPIYIRFGTWMENSKINIENGRIEGALSAMKMEATERQKMKQKNPISIHHSLHARLEFNTKKRRQQSQRAFMVLRLRLLFVSLYFVLCSALLFFCSNVFICMKYFPFAWLICIDH